MHACFSTFIETTFPLDSDIFWLKQKLSICQIWEASARQKWELGSWMLIQATSSSLHMHTAWDDAQAGSIHICAVEDALSPEPEADRETFKR